MGTTNVTAAEVNYHHYSTQQYDRDIRNSIPFHDEIHHEIEKFINSEWNPNAPLGVLDLGVGTGISSKLVQTLLPDAELTVVDFSDNMMAGARKKLGDKNVNYVLADYSSLVLGHGYDIIMSIIGLHHQTDVGKVLMFNKIRQALDPNTGCFIFGDLVTFQNPHTAAMAAANHYHHLVEKAADDQTLKEWAHHHMFLNQLAPLEDQIRWLTAAGFNSVEVKFLRFQTALIIAS